MILPPYGFDQPKDEVKAKPNRKQRRARQRHAPFFTKKTVWFHEEYLTKHGQDVRNARLKARRKKAYEGRRANLARRAGH